MESLRDVGKSVNTALKCKNFTCYYGNYLGKLLNVVQIGGVSVLDHNLRTFLAKKLDKSPKFLQLFSRKPLNWRFITIALQNHQKYPLIRTFRVINFHCKIKNPPKTRISMKVNSLKSPMNPSESNKKPISLPNCPSNSQLQRNNEKETIPIYIKKLWIFLFLNNCLAVVKFNRKVTLIIITCLIIELKKSIAKQFPLTCAVFNVSTEPNVLLNNKISFVNREKFPELI